MTRPPAVGVYIHWPWCLSKCPYCDFNSQAVDPKALNQADWRQSLLAELNHCLGETDVLPIGSVFFGGGTPSLIDPKTVAALLELLAKHRSVSKSLEVTLEANPGTVTAGRLDAFRQAGVNRVSLGVQSLDNQSLKAIGRTHDAKQALKALDLIRKRFDRCSIDLIYGRPGHGLKDWGAELKQALDLGLDHYSLYQLTYEPRTPLGRAVQRGDLTPQDSDAEADFYKATLERMRRAGRPAYEISNFASGPKHQCRHNLDIWRGGAYLGIGPGAHGRESRGGKLYATERLTDPARWLHQIAAKGHGYKTNDPVLPGERAQELVLLGLRLTRGIDRKLYNQLTGFDLLEVIHPLAVRRLVQEGYISRNCTKFKVTEKGRLLLDSITRILLAESP